MTVRFDLREEALRRDSRKPIMVSLRGFAFGSTLLLVAACGGSDDDSGQKFLDDYCGAIAPCCVRAGYSGDTSSCRGFLGLGMSSSVDVDAANACVAATRAAVAKDAKFCDTLSSPEVDAACSKVVPKSASTGTHSVAPGGACSNDGDCAASAEGTAHCVYAGSNSRVCQIWVPGKAGDSPCVSTIEAGGSSTVFTGNEAPPVKGFSCAKSDKVTCDIQSHTCVAMQEPGASCKSDEGCVQTAWCDLVKGTCAARAAVGAACSGMSSCDDKGYCDGPSSTCKARADVGAACEESQECLSGICSNKKCGPPFAGGFIAAFMCGGFSTGNPLRGQCGSGVGIVSRSSDSSGGRVDSAGGGDDMRERSAARHASRGIAAAVPFAMSARRATSCGV